MKARVAAAVLALAALAVHLGLTSRYRTQAAAAADEFRQVRDERKQVGSRLAHKLRLEDAQRRAGQLPTAQGGLTPTRAARLQVVRSLQGSGVSRVHLGVAPAPRSPQAVNVRLTGEGSFEDVLRFAGHIVRPGSGLLLQDVALQNQDERVALVLEAVGVARP